MQRVSIEYLFSRCLVRGQENREGDRGEREGGGERDTQRETDRERDRQRQRENRERDREDRERQREREISLQMLETARRGGIVRTWMMM
jgi:hypothetical protein